MLDSQSQSNKPHQVIPDNIHLLAPGEQILVDFADFNNKNMLVEKDHVSGLVWAKLTKDQTSEEAFKAIVEWCHKYVIQHCVGKDSCGSFRWRFVEKLREMGIDHTYANSVPF